MKPWYEQSFGSDYMLVYKHRDWENANEEARKMIAWLKLPKNAQMLDIGCGMGRHALALAGFGYSVTGIDLSQTLLDEARKHDEKELVNWRQGDMRELPFEPGSFDCTVNLFTSFGYFSLEEDNVNVLRQIAKVLRKNGSFLIDFLNPAYVEKTLIPSSDRTDEEAGIHIQELRSITDGWVQKEITVTELENPDKARQYLERVRLFPLAWFERNLANAGLVLEQLYGDYDGCEYEAIDSPRMIMTGRTK
ncbi:ubiquinone/menaquinone biosynthesis C-methylase UbiE [Paenibacillus endophyticus]|uniref:Ubiquinone/menaquinone biosynthesis C-methylase UbiE n=1 Tax=Paenibacillus endophyticus TaxID=1294268 RepID=A0A7W5G7M2_9BACL|nr:class I SAM-dependent methyltransferase [Paenibacillus endophyticus]MBB3150129.1 ubiquinone/menaquinone biosynthesis C-methylase UbiE [Paenibacillus endophyticus]